ncbi:MAG: hypothetical protein JST82_13250 [Bacteroidetes bacterium]|nr:hypothetical protein [Bacteroidota bacterium]
MYCISDEQIDFILNDIRRNGVEKEDLQLNLLDHICCIIEQNLEDNGNFEDFYSQVIKKFYHQNLHEIEEEAELLLTFKNYYAMKKVLITTGTFSAAAFVMGSIFKAMHWPGAGVLLCLAILVTCFIFLPLFYILKNKEVKTGREKWMLASGTLTGILYALSVLFAIQHWPGVTILWLTTVVLSFFVFIPLYFFTGIKHTEARFNTIVTTVLLVGATGLLFTMIRVRDPLPIQMYAYVKSEHLLKHMQEHSAKNNNSLAIEINKSCEALKASLLIPEIGVSSIPDDFESRNMVITERSMTGVFGMGKNKELLEQLKANVHKYNASLSNTELHIPIDHSVLDMPQDKIEMFSNLAVLNNIVQIQMFLANSKSATVACAK